MRRCFAVLVVLAACYSVGRLQAGVDADPNREYAIEPAVGSWTICAASETGESAHKMAHDLVMEVRARYNLPAYLYNRGDEMRRQQQEEIEKKRQQQKEYLERMGLKPDTPLPIRRARIEDQYVVLIGGFSSMESARRELDRIKKLPPPRSVPSEPFTLERGAPGARPDQIVSQRTEINPFTNSFVVPNPTLPPPGAENKKPDPEWKKWNAYEPYSLLKCRKPWTLAIKVFQGTTIVQPASKPSSVLDKLWNENKGQQLDASAMNAHNMAEALRKLHFEAYVLHTWGTSIVTVGGFDSSSDPQMSLAERRLYSSDHTLLGPNLDSMARPMPMEVPRY